MTADRTRFHSTRSSESRSEKGRSLTYSTTIITNRSPVRGHEIAFALRFRVDGRMRSTPLNSSPRGEKPGGKDSGSLKNVDPGPSWSVGFTLVPEIFPIFHFSPGLLASEWSKPARPLFSNFWEEKAGQATVTL
jgi:hypothetical protein